MLKFALLELLSSRALSGYELNKRFKASIITFWHASHTQIYQQLRKLEAEGLVVSQKEIQEDKPNKRTYYITSRGREALRRWLLEPPGLQGIKDDMLLKVFAFGLLPPEAALGQLREHQRLHEQKLALLTETRRRMDERYGAVDDPTVGNELFFRLLTLHHRLRYEASYIEWCRWAIELISARLAAGQGSRQPDPVPHEAAIEA
ncbi:MAG: PadR family transcriptional regulator [Deltaproteobacteria bacterium]|nr:PadR family transcriptional regulator [Deltaproteobacteria bacterium]